MQAAAPLRQRTCSCAVRPPCLSRPSRGRGQGRPVVTGSPATNSRHSSAAHVEGRERKDQGEIVLNWLPSVTSLIVPPPARWRRARAWRARASVRSGCGPAAAVRAGRERSARCRSGGRAVQTGGRTRYPRSPARWILRAISAIFRRRLKRRRGVTDVTGRSSTPASTSRRCSA